MGRRMDFSGLTCLYAKGETFELTDAQYEDRFKKPLPKDIYYLKNRSPLAINARENGFSIEISEEPVIQRKIIFKKNAP